MKTLGIIGGLGPETTAEFYLELVFGAYKKHKEDRPPILIWNIPLKYKIEEDLLTKATGEERYIPYLTEAARRLEAGGAELLVIPCNSVHAFINEVRQAAGVPVLSIVEETVAFLKSQKVSKVGILSTQSTLKSKLYEKELIKAGIENVTPDESDQLILGNVIERIVLNKHTDADKERLFKIINKFAEKGVNDVLLACTDLQLLKPHHEKLRIHDTMKILSESAINQIVGDPLLTSSKRRKVV